MKNLSFWRAQRFLSALVVVVTWQMICAAKAHAGFISIQSDSLNSAENLGSFTGSISYSSTSASTGTLIITLTNTSVAANAGFITGFVFNIDSSDADASAELESASHPFLDTQGGSASPYGADFDAGAALGGSFLGGGGSQSGIAVGETGTFTFQLIADDAESLTPESFLNGPYDFNFIVRFKAFADGGSDKVPATTMVVPSPGAFGLLALGMVGLRRRRR